MAIKRGGGDGLYLEEIPFRSMDADGDDPHWEDAIPDTAKDAQYIEETTAMQDIRQKMQAFFRTYLTSDLQIQVAEAHFLDGLTPKEIAQLMGKHSHEIRMLKARVIQQLRSLPQEKRQILLEILSVATDLSFNEVDDE
jgi:DNA-directed RNA polymerase specialized sigma24 family protein